MRRCVMLSVAFVSVLYFSAMRGAVAMPAFSTMPDHIVTLSSPSMIQNAYYYRGRYYPYRYHGAYYGHRYYRYGRWHYY